MTKRQREVFDAIVTYTGKNGYSPSMRELTELVNARAVSTVFGVLERLRRDGFITWEESKPRTMRVLKEAS
ncbi:hypothetical protein [Salibacterium halotolerans]|uniref:LexA family protein n=1 Tax=Salibacterium halotolerans TaxID=1884432 RepID=UPI000B83BC2B|nr:hypothetical protein [Salibacterium halotolerans]